MKDDVPAAVLIKQPNPRNVENASKLQELEREISRLEQEKATWSDLLKTITVSLNAEPSLSDAKRADTSSSRDPDPLLLMNQQQIDFAKILSSRKESQEDVQKRVQAASESLEFKIDSLASSVHQVRCLDTFLGNRTDDVLGQAAKSLEERDRNRQDDSETEKVGIGDLLRSFSRAAS